MPRLIPARSQRPSDDLIFALNGEAQRRRAAGESVVNATLGSLLDEEGRLLVLPTVARAIREVSDEDWAAYAPIAGPPAFLEAVIADCFGPRTAFRDAATAVATTGGTGALRHAMVNYLEPGQALLTTDFFWGPYATLADEQERRVATFPMFGADGNLDVDALGSGVDRCLAEQGRCLLFLNDPCHNPTGYSMSRAEWDAVASALLARADEGPITLLIDLAYFLYGAAEDPRSFLDAIEPLLGRVGLLFAWSASKSFAQYGLRVGALVACEPDRATRDATAAALSFSCRGTWSNCNRGGMAAITRVLTDPTLHAACDADRDRARDLLMQRVRAFNEAAQGLRYPRYEGGFFVTVFHEDALAQAARMRESGVFVVPQGPALRLALCSVPVRDVPRLAASLRGSA
ncbi:MAG: pyridoxal phosphate-dependent aminotransferase [Planctomycetota bacterium]